MWKWRCRILWVRALRACAIALFCVYVGWNAYWLACGQIPPSLFSALTGLPCATTGGSRAVRSLLAGDWRASLRFNVMAAPICALLAVTACQLLTQWVRRQRKVLPPWLAWLWMVTLAAAWIIQLVVWV